MLKEKRIRSAKHLLFIRLLPCCVCLKSPCEAAHIRIGGNGGIGLKPGDDKTIPLTHDCHAAQHLRGERSFFKDIERVRKLAKDLYSVTGNIDAGTKLVLEYWRETCSSF